MIDPSPRPAPKAHIGALDSLRGLAALVVVLHHVWLLGLLTPHSTWLWRALRYSPARAVLEGRAPVILFFVLSGFVLAHGLLRQPTGYASFIVRRISRVYPPFAIAILLSALGYALVEPGPQRPLGMWFASFWQNGHDLPTLARHLLMLGDRRDDLDPVVWSLVPELRISALLPLLLWLGRRNLPALLAGALLLQWLSVPFGVDAGTGLACRAWWSCKPFWGQGFAGSLMVSLYFVVFFVLGLGLAVERARLRRWMAMLPPRGHALLLGLGLVCFSGIPSTNDLVYGLGATLLIAVALESPATARVLGMAPLPWLGRISYSLYLVHLPVFLAVVYATGLTGPGMIPLLLALSLAAAWGFYHAVEAPCRDWGREWTRRVTAQAREDRARARA